MRAVEDADAWCVFDNTASGAAIENAWDLHVALEGTLDMEPRLRE